MANQKGSRQLKHSDRIRLEALYNAGHKVVEIAEILHEYVLFKKIFTISWICVKIINSVNLL